MVIAVFLPGAVSAKGIYDPAAIKAFYEGRGAQFFWQNGNGLTSDGAYLAELVGSSWRHGLNPETYHSKKILALVGSTDQASRAQLEILLTDAFTRYVHDMTGIRIDPKDFNMDAEDWRQPFDVATSLGVLATTDDVQDFLDSIAPTSQTYLMLQAELEKLALGPSEPYIDILPINLSGVILNPGQRHKKIPDIRLRLGVQVQTQDEYLYDDRLAAAIMKFQQRSGLPPDGMIGPTTIKLLNRSDRDKMLQIVANMERLRWVDGERPGRFVMVNIPAATLWAIDGGKVAFQMPVVVGRPERETQVFIADIEGVRFNPGWTVPPTIKREDILPKLRENPDYLNDKGMELIAYTSEGPKTIDASRVDWEDITDRDLSRMDMVQIPGAHNPLGNIRILMPNRYNIYLHDTNQPEYFDRQQRAHSSGCIRMKDPRAMAKFLLQDMPEASEERMNAMIAAGKTHDVKIPAPVKVYILYYSAWSDENGQIIFGNDIYDLDKKLAAKLRAIDGIYLPGHNEASDKSSQAGTGL